MRKELLKIATGLMALMLMTSACKTTTADLPKTGLCEIVPPEEPVACTMQYDPVCGCDGKTYSNACMARGAGVPDSTPGACEKNANE